MAKASPTQPKLSSESPCPCGTGRTYGTCCEPVLKQARPAANAEELMRSRYTAHAVGDHRHLHRTYLESSRLPYVEDTDAPELKWQRLVVHAHEPGSSPDQAFVDFTAYYTDQGTEYPLAEKSEFRRINGQWFYTRTVRTGPAPIKSAGPKVGRNDPCPCGSGKKFKQCCGR